MTTIKPTERQNAAFFVACGMYALTDQLRCAWQQLFEHFFDLAKPTFEINRLLNFDTGEAVLNDPSLWFGQTCGYPLMTRLHNSLTPVSLPVFDIAGCDDTHYSSLLIVSENSAIKSLRDCEGLRAVINSNDSNSGMNVLRHAVADFNQQGSFFNDIQISGSHLQSLTEVANQRADIAAIDCVSYRFIEDTWPELTARVRSIGFTAKTCGLPFVIPKQSAHKRDFAEITEALNRALSRLDNKQKDRLHLKGFQNVEMEDYASILDLEASAVAAGYPILA
jgi:ABC-type phosphate/phosphonate transport system substrate-binding protein